MFLTFDTPLNFCDICDEDKIWFTVFAAPCGHRFCTDCLTTLFGLCTTDEEVYPPRCCTQTIPLDRVNGGLSRELVETFRAKSIEWETKDRTYCYNTKCAKFIPPKAITLLWNSCWKSPNVNIGSAVTHALDWSYLLTAAITYLVLAVRNSATFADLAGCLDLANVVCGMSTIWQEDRDPPTCHQIAAADSSRFDIQSWIMSVRFHRCWRERLVSVSKKADETLSGCVKAMSDNLPIPSSNTFPHAGHFLYRNRNLLRINQLQIIPVTVKLILRIHLKNTECSTDQQEQW
ncbi:hypothetical protein D6D06_07531 [Aureobasidium pullulans]|nr:hypothetical protein D6D06_07531 [Aureobasidium pullulans]